MDRGEGGAARRGRGRRRQREDGAEDCPSVGAVRRKPPQTLCLDQGGRRCSLLVFALADPGMLRSMAPEEPGDDGASSSYFIAATQQVGALGADPKDPSDKEPAPYRGFFRGRVDHLIERSEEKGPPWLSLGPVTFLADAVVKDKEVVMGRWGPCRLSPSSLPRSCLPISGQTMKGSICRPPSSSSVSRARRSRRRRSRRRSSGARGTAVSPTVGREFGPSDEDAQGSVRREASRGMHLVQILERTGYTRNRTRARSLLQSTCDEGSAEACALLSGR